MVDPDAVFVEQSSCFPCHPYTGVYLCGLSLPSGEMPCTELSPAHKADVAVAFALSEEVRDVDTLACFQPSHRLEFRMGDSLTGAAELSFSCRTARFSHGGPRMIAGEGWKRLQTVVDEVLARHR